LLDTDTEYRFHGVTICESDRRRFEVIKHELYRLCSTALFDQVEVTIQEIQLPPIVQRKVWGARPEEKREPIYRTASQTQKCSRPYF